MGSAVFLQLLLNRVEIVHFQLWINLHLVQPDCVYVVECVCVHGDEGTYQPV